MEGWRCEQGRREDGGWREHGRKGGWRELGQRAGGACRDGGQVARAGPVEGNVTGACRRGMRTAARDVDRVSQERRRQMGKEAYRFDTLPIAGGYLPPKAR